MEYSFVLYFLVMKGLGPDWTDKYVTTYFDDVEEETPEQLVRDWAMQDAKEYLPEKWIYKMAI